MDRSQFERLALRYLDEVYRVAYHLTRSVEEAEDLVQEVYLRALRPEAVEGFEDRGGGMRAWLFKITNNCFYSHLRRESKAPQAMGDVSQGAALDLSPDEPPPAWDRASLDWETVDDKLKRAIERLIPEHREVLLMWGVDGLKYREIATILDLPIGTVMSRLFRARRLVAEVLTSDGRAVGEGRVPAGGRQ